MHKVLILGASSDLAKALAHVYAQEGYDLILAGRSTEKLEPVAKDLEVRYGKKAEIKAWDGRDFASHATFIEGLGELPEVTISVFGYLGNQEKAMTDFGKALNIIESNYTGQVSMLNRIAEKYMAQKKGTIIGISSVAGERGRQSNYIYGSAKAGFTAYLDGLRNRCFHHGVHVITVKPGFMRTAMTEGMPLNPKLTAEPMQAAKVIYKAFRKKKNSLYVLWMWKYIMWIIRNIPEGKFKKMKM